MTIDLGATTAALGASPFGGARPVKDTTVHFGLDDLPWCEQADGSSFQVLQVDLNIGLLVARVRWLPGTSVPTHYHTGPVYAVTHSGCWYYEEYPETRNVAGSYLFEPAHSMHTLTVPSDNSEVTEAWFATYGANLNIDGDGTIYRVVDARSVLAAYRKGCAAAGLDASGTLVIGE